MTTLAALVAATPAASRGQPVQIPAAAGAWRHVLELADPAAGSSVEWFDITEWWCGYEYTRGADQYQGRNRASVATVELCVDDDRFAPWNADTSDTFGVHVELGPGLLIRSGFIRVDGGVVVEWLPRFTNKVESWGDAAYSAGKIRRHQIVARDLLTSLVTLPLPASSEENWSDRMFFFLTQTAWPYGSAIYGAQFESDTTTPILLLPDRPAASSALNELDATLDPVGLVWYTNRLGQLVVRPRVDDTFHADAFAAGATGNPWPEPDTATFGWYACADDETSDTAAYAADNRVEPFGLDRTERAIVNHVKITYPAGGFDDDDPISIQRYDRKTLQASWIAANDTIAAAILGSRAYATVAARPLHTALGMPGFMPATSGAVGPAGLEFLYPVHVDHRNNDAGLSAYADGWVRSIREEVIPRGCDVDWALTFVIDVYAIDSDAGLLPVEDLAVDDVTESTAELSWTNPTQVITPTNTQIRLLSTSSIWSTVAYPITDVVWSSLAPATIYTFQVRLIRIVDGLITHYSPARQVTFVTDTASVPVVDGDTVTFPPPTPPCDEIDWWLEQSVDGTTWTTLDSGTLTDEPWTVDLSGYTFDPVKAYRVKMDACGTVSYSDVFNNACTAPPILGDPPFDDPALVAYWPAICPPDTIVEALTEAPAVHGPAFDTWVLDGDSSVVLVAAGEGNVALGGNPPALAGLTGDATIACKVNTATQPDAPVVLFSAAALQIEAIAVGANWSVRGKANEEGAGITTITGSTELDFGTWYDIALVHDAAAGDLILYINAINEVDALGTVGERAAATVFAIGQSDNGLITNCAVWDRVLADSELPGYVAPSLGVLYDAIQALSPLSHWPIRETTGSTLDDVGSLANDASGAQTSELGDITAPDGFPAPVFTGTGTNGGSAPDQAGYSWDNASGLTVVCAVRPEIGAGGNGVLVAKRADDGTVPEWEVGISPVTGTVYARTYNTAGTITREFTTSFPGVGDEGWALIIARFGSTATSFPDLRINGYAPPGAQTGSGTAASGGAAKLQIGRRFTTPHLVGSLAHVAIFAGQLTDLQCATMESAALTEGWIDPTGGTVTTPGDGYRYHTLTTSGEYFRPFQSLAIEGIVVGGGGGGGGWHRGGGGAGGDVVPFTATVATPQLVTIGAGGTKGGTGSTPGPPGTAGGTSSLGSIASAVGGGRGGGGNDAYAATSGGSGGGGSGVATNSPHAGAAAGSGTNVNAGAQGSATNNAGGGGGGAGGAGVSSATTSNGGIGYEWPPGSGQRYGGGGGGGRFTSFGAGGAGGGGNGGGDNTSGANGLTNRGGGGGGAGNFSTTAQEGGNGGSGVVIVRYPWP